MNNPNKDPYSNYPRQYSNHQHNQSSFYDQRHNSHLNHNNQNNSYHSQANNHSPYYQHTYHNGWNQIYPSNLYDTDWGEDYYNHSNQTYQKGFQKVGRYGGTKKKNGKNKEQNASLLNQSKASSSNGPKIRLPTVKQESANAFCFAAESETTNFVECPFNPNHMMEPGRLLTHIGKCKLKSPNAIHYSVCPYDPCHYFSKSQIEAHLLVCQKRGLFVANEDWNQGPLNSSTIESLKEQPQSQVIKEDQKMPFSILSNQAKILFEQLLIDP